MKLNIGSSSCHLDGWINLEYDEAYWRKHSFSGERLSSKATRNMPDVFGDARYLGALYESGIFDEVRSSHVLEHIPQSQTLLALSGWHTVLKPGGIVRVIVPDFQFFIDKWNNRENEKEWWAVQMSDKGLYCDSERKAPFKTLDDAFVHLIFLNGHHLNAFTYDLLSEYMMAVGFVDIERCDKEEEDIPDCTVCDYSLRLKGIKNA